VRKKMSVGRVTAVNGPRTRTVGLLASLVLVGASNNTVAYNDTISCMRNRGWRSPTRRSSACNTSRK
jgi:hypothetical protein